MRPWFTLLLAPAIALVLTSCRSDPAVVAAKQGRILAVGAESQYASVIRQIGGRYVLARAVETNPNTDPHEFQASPSIARLVGEAQIVVQNGLGYDAFMSNIEAASSSPSRRVIDVQKLLGLRDSTPNPHLWYAPDAMGVLAHTLMVDLSKLQPAHAGYFAANEQRFQLALARWTNAMQSFEARYPHTPVAVTEPVGNYMLQFVGARIMTPFGLQADAMNGVDPSPQDIAFQHSLLSRHRVKVFLYNQQVTDTLTDSFLSQAKREGIPVVGLYETMPAGYDYQSWMLAEVGALERAVAHGTSTERLP